MMKLHRAMPALLCALLWLSPALAQQQFDAGGKARTSQYCTTTVAGDTPCPTTQTVVATQPIPVTIDNVVDGAAVTMTPLSTTGVLYENDNATGIAEFNFSFSTVTGTAVVAVQWSNDNGGTWTTGYIYKAYAPNTANQGIAPITFTPYIVDNHFAAVRLNLVTCTTCSVAGTVVAKKFPAFAPPPVISTWHTTVTLTSGTGSGLNTSCGTGLKNYVDYLSWSAIATTVADQINLVDGASTIWSDQIPAGAGGRQHNFPLISPESGTAATAMSVILSIGPTGQVEVNATGHCAP